MNLFCFPASKDYVSKVAETSQNYGKEKLEMTGKYAEQAYEAGKEKVEKLIDNTQKKLDL